MIKLLIVGAGISGLALARRLTNTNVKVTIIERDTNFPIGGAGICLPPNAVIQMKRFGLYDRLLKASHHVNYLDYAKSNGTPIASASLLEAPLNKAEFVVVRRQALLELLQYNMSQTVCFGSQVTKMANSEAGVFVHVNHSSRPEFFDLVVAADGTQSTTRQLAIKNSKARALGVTNWRFVVEHVEQEINPIQLLGDDHAFMIYPLSATTSYCYAQIADPFNQWRHLPPVPTLHTLFSHYCEPVKKMLRAINDTTRVFAGSLETVNLSNTFELRTVLIGDALHGCPPNLLQGAAMGLEDANLLADLITRFPVDDALQMYNEERLPRVRWVMDEAIRQNEILMKSKSWPGRLIRNTLLRQNGPAEVAAWRKLLLDTQDLPEQTP